MMCNNCVYESSQDPFLCIFDTVNTSWFLEDCENVGLWLKNVF